jgi:hypothetical protein
MDISEEFSEGGCQEIVSQGQNTGGILSTETC